MKDLVSLADYRHISISGCIYKNFAKFLANRLKRVIGSVIDEVQSTDISGRNILDVPLVMNEIYNWAKWQRSELFFSKLIVKKHLTLSTEDI